MAGKLSKGKQKIEMKRIENDEARQVTFSKRRTGLFKKGSELTTLCGADVMLLVFSPAGRPYSFGQPEVDLVMSRFLSIEAPLSLPDPDQRHRPNVVHQLNQHYAQMVKRVELMKARRKILEEKVKEASGNRKHAWESGFEDFNLEELQHLSNGLGELKVRADARVAEILIGGGASSSRAPLVVNPINMLNPFVTGGADYHQLYEGTLGFDPEFN